MCRAVLCLSACKPEAAVKQCSKGCQRQEAVMHCDAVTHSPAICLAVLRACSHHGSCCRQRHATTAYTAAAYHPITAEACQVVQCCTRLHVTCTAVAHRPPKIQQLYTMLESLVAVSSHRASTRVVRHTSTCKERGCGCLSHTTGVTQHLTQHLPLCPLLPLDQLQEPMGQDLYSRTATECAMLASSMAIRVTVLLCHPT